MLNFNSVCVMKTLVCMTTSKLSSFLLVSLCLFITTLVIGETCIKVECGCQFKNGSGTYEISMKGISSNTSATFTDIPDTGGIWTYLYAIDPCYGFYENTDCQDVSMCQKNTDKSKFIPVAKPNISNYGDYEEGKPVQVRYALYKWKDGIVRQLVINLNPIGDDGQSKVSQSITSSNLHQYTWNITSNSLRPRLVQPSPGGSSSSGGGFSIGSLFVIVFFVVVVIYLVAGILFMKCKRGATGKEVIPNFEFWAALPGLIKDGCVFSSKKMKDLCHCKRDSYSTIQ